MWAASQLIVSTQFEKGLLAPIAIPIFVAGLLLMAAAVASFIKARTTINPLRPANASQLITTGVFRYSRNPIYLADLLLLDAWALWLGNVINLLFLFIFIWYIQRYQIAREERALHQRFGDHYVAYCSKVRRWL